MMCYNIKKGIIMENLDIYKFIEEFELNKNNFLEFITTLCNYFSERFKVRKCDIRIINLEANEKYGGYIPPSRFGCALRKHKNLDAQEEWLTFQYNF